MKNTILLLFAISFVSSVFADDPPRGIDVFLETHCLDCHSDGQDSDGELDLSELAFQLDNTASFDKWVHVVDRVASGEMPPADTQQPDAVERETFVSELSKLLNEADEKSHQQLGRGVIRRLNRSEFETVLSDLLHLPLDIQEELPEDARSHGFNTVGSALNVSSVQMEAYLEVLDTVLDQATTLYEKPKRRTHRLSYLENVGTMQVYRKGGPFLVQDDGVAFFATEKFSHHNSVLSQWTAPYSGRYRIKLSAYAVRSDQPIIVSVRAGGTGHAESNHVPHVFLDHFSVVEGEPQTFEWEGWLQRGHYLHVYPTSLRPMRFAPKKPDQQMQRAYEGPAAVVQWVDVDGPILETWPPKSHVALWGDTPIEQLEGSPQNQDPIAHLDRPPAKVAKPRMTRVAANKATGNRFVYDPKKQKSGGEPIHSNASIPKPLFPTMKLAPSNPRQQAVHLLLTFAERAFRRPSNLREVEPFIGLAHRWLDEGRGFEESMRVAYKAMLVSPGFLYHQKPLTKGTSTLSQHALAERLALFLWNGLPDEELLELAMTETLSESKVLKSQTVRLLQDDRSDRFLDQFLNQWLDQRLIDFTVPDEKLYPEFDPLLKWSMVEETRAFVRHLIDNDLPVSNIVDSDFAMINWRLARHYDLPSVAGMQVRAVTLPAESPRGGIIGQGSILKVTANGTTTSPVVRGVWMMERIMGITPDPPPPGIPAIEPDIRGATTVRQQLEQHRSVASCASCHAKIDPPGVALECFDVIGGWRDNYRALNPELEDLKPKYEPKGPPPIQYVTGPEVNASYELADGRSFEDINGFRELLLQDRRRIARGLVEKLLVYSTGAELSFADRDEVEAILDRAKVDGTYGFRNLIQEVIASPLFASK